MTQLGHLLRKWMRQFGLTSAKGEMWSKVHVIHVVQAPQISERRKIIELKEKGKSYSQISREIGLSQSTVFKWLKRYAQEGTISNRPRVGAPRHTTDDETRAIIAAAEGNPLQNALNIQQDLQLCVGTATVRRRLREAGIYFR